MAKRPLGIPRCHANLVVVCGGLYLVGGRTRLDGPPATITSLSGIDVYDENTDTWRRVADLRVPRHDAGCAVIGRLCSHIMKGFSPFPLYQNHRGICGIAFEPPWAPVAMGRDPMFDDGTQLICLFLLIIVCLLVCLFVCLVLLHVGVGPIGVTLRIKGKINTEISAHKPFLNFNGVF